MNNNYYPTYPSSNVSVNSFDNTNLINNSSNIQNNIVFNDPPFIQNLLKLNKSKLVTIYFSYPLYNEKSAFKGIIESIGNDFITLRDTKCGKYYILPYNNLNYIEFDEKINYSNKAYT